MLLNPGRSLANVAYVNVRLLATATNIAPANASRTGPEATDDRSGDRDEDRKRVRVGLERAQNGRPDDTRDPREHRSEHPRELRRARVVHASHRGEVMPIRNCPHPESGLRAAQEHPEQRHAQDGGDEHDDLV